MNEEGWFQFAVSAQIKKNKIYTFNYFNTSFICYRNAQNSIKVFNAYCPHLGAHLGVGGKIVNDLLVCPFHGWKYNSDGLCVTIPSSNKIPKRAQLQSYTAQKIDSLIFFYHQNSVHDISLKDPPQTLDELPFVTLSFKHLVTTQMANYKFQILLEKAKQLFELTPISSGLFIVKSKNHFVSLLIAVTPINQNESSIAYSLSLKKHVLNFLLFNILKRKAKKQFASLISSPDSLRHK